MLAAVSNLGNYSDMQVRAGSIIRVLTPRGTASTNLLREVWEQDWANNQKPGMRLHQQTWINKNTKMT